MNRGKRNYQLKSKELIIKGSIGMRVRGDRRLVRGEHASTIQIGNFIFH